MLLPNAAPSHTECFKDEEFEQEGHLSPLKEVIKL